MNIAWIGTGVMGSVMACHLKKAGHFVKVYNRTIEKAKPLAKEGIIVCESIKECISDCDIIFTMVGLPSDVEEVYFNEEGIIRHAKQGAYLIDMTTSSPSLAKRIAKEAIGFHVLDAPVSGGDIGAKNKTLSVMCGGNLEDFEKMKDIFRCFASAITYQGIAGSGQHCKACNQIAIAGSIAGVAEALTYAQKMNLNPETVFQAIAKGAAGSFQMSHNGIKMLQEDYEPGFYMKHFIKDMKIALSELEQEDFYLPVLNQVKKIYDTLSKMGYDDAGTQAIIEYYRLDH